MTASPTRHPIFYQPVFSDVVRARPGMPSRLTSAYRSSGLRGFSGSTQALVRLGCYDAYVEGSRA